MKEKIDYSKPIAQVVYFDNEDILARSVTCHGTEDEVYHDWCRRNDCLAYPWMDKN